MFAMFEDEELLASWFFIQINFGYALNVEIEAKKADSNAAYPRRRACPV